MPSTTTLPVRQAAGIAMDTVVSIQVVTDRDEASVRPALQRALRWFATVEHTCSRFDPNSELRQLIARPGEPVQVSPVLFDAVRFAVHLARATGGIFDPTIGRRPLALDLGAVAKGLAIDLASCELLGFEDFRIEAGGDLFAGGHNPDGRPWRIGVRDPRERGAMATTLEVSDRAVCTSGDYERKTADGAGHHLLDPRTGRSAAGLASLTVVAPTAMAADGLATAAFILGLDAGRRLLEQSDVAGVFITPSGEIHRTTT
jgi:thiamine biosynthesis lipoprotein